MSEETSERYLPNCCRESYRGENGSYHETGPGEAEFTCLICGTDWTVVGPDRTEAR